MTEMVYGSVPVRNAEPVLPKWWRTIDTWSMSCILILFGIGLLLGFAASPPLASKTGLPPFHYVERQALFGGLALIAMFLTSMMSPHLVRRLAVIGFIGALIALMGLPFFGTDFGKGAMRWYSLGFASVQPSEFLKPGFIVVAAWMLAAGQEINGPPGRLWSLMLAAATYLERGDTREADRILSNLRKLYPDSPYLESAFLIRRVVRLDRDAKRFKRIVAFKVYLTAPCMYTALFGPVGADSEVFGRLAETAVFCQWLGSESVGHMAYASWRGGKGDMVGSERRANSPIRQGRPWVVAEMDWNERLIYSQAGPRALGEFVRTNCPEAVAYVMTRSVARPGLLDGIQVRVMPIALACYLLHKDVMARTTRILDEEAQNAESPLVLTPGKSLQAAS